jgi:hypothetical protein
VKREVRIDSYFSLPTDLASALGKWPEFVSGKDYSALLTSEQESVTTSLEYDEDQPFVWVRGDGDGPLFFRVLGVAFWELAGHSDSVWPSITRWSSEPLAVPPRDGA